MTTLRATQVDVPPDMIDLGIGQPGFSLLPHALMQQATEHRLAQGDMDLLNYGAEQGDGAFLIALAQFLEEGYGFFVDPHSLCVTAGASQALDLIYTLWIEPGDVIFVEEPTYFIGLQILADHQPKMVGIPTDENGLIVEALETALKQHRPKLLYTIPTFQNPTGTTLSLERRQRLVELSIEYDFLIVADEVYQLLSYQERPPAPIARFLTDQAILPSGRENILSIGSFSKILAPGLRVGWIQGAPAWIKRIVQCGLVYSGGSLNHFTSNLVRSALQLGLQQEYLTQLKVIYQKRASTMSRALHHYLPETITFDEPRGGFFFWLKFPETVDTKQLLTTATQYDVEFQPGVNFSSNQGLQNYMRLSFAFYDESALQEGVRRLAKTLDH